MLWLVGALLLVHVVAIDEKPWQVLDEEALDISEEALGFGRLSSKTKAYIEQCVVDPFLETQINCGNNPYAGLIRLAFHDCGTFDKTASKDKGGCNAWMSKKCTQFDQCEYTAPENNGLKMWVDPLDSAYDTAKVQGKNLKSYLSRADFWHLAAYRALRKSSGGNVKPDFVAGRVDATIQSPRFRGRIPDAFAWSEMQRVAHRNGMDDVTAAALVGAHTLGQCHPKTSGYQGAWDPTPFVFDELFWDGLLDLKWFAHQIDAVNSQTGEQTSKLQFSLGGDNFDRSVMLFTDMEMHVNLDKCDFFAEDVANGKCPKNDDPFDLPSAIRTWADSPKTFFTAFAGAWETMSRWGCSNCYEVDEYSYRVDCSSVYKHTCKAGYPEKTSYWKPGYKTPAPVPTSRKTVYSTPKPTPRPPYGPTPKPTTTTKPPYKPATTTKPTYKPTTTAKPTYKPTTAKPTYKPTTKPPTTYAPKPTPTHTTTYRPTSTIPIITGTISKSPPKESTTPPPTTTPETTAPETTYPETTYPETTYPETTYPETTYPETTYPETTYPETTYPETTYPETTYPETTPTTYPPSTTTTTYPPPTTTTTYPPPTTTTTYPPPTTTTTYPPPTTTTTYPPPTTTTNSPYPYRLK